MTLVYIWLVGRKKRYGWLVGLAAQPVWAAFAWLSGAWGLFVFEIVYTAIVFHNWRRWGETHE